MRVNPGCHPVLFAAASLAAAAVASDLIRARGVAGQDPQITALVTVVSESGEPITDLTAADFTVRENKITHVVGRVRPVHDLPVFVAILVDVSKPLMGTQAPVTDMRGSLSAFVSAMRAANPAVQFSLTQVAGAAVPAVAFGAKPEDLDAAIARLYPGQQADAVMLEGLAEAARSLQDKPGLRKAIVAVDFASSEPSRESTMRASIEELQKAEATLWTVSIRGAGATAAARREMAFKAGVEVSGGVRQTAVAASGLTSMLTAVAGSLSSQYLVTFSRPGSASINFDSIAVSTARGNKALVALLMR